MTVWNNWAFRCTAVKGIMLKEWFEKLFPWWHLIPNGNYCNYYKSKLITPSVLHKIRTLQPRYKSTGVGCSHTYIQHNFQSAGGLQDNYFTVRLRATHSKFPMTHSLVSTWKAIAYLILSEKAEISVVTQSRGRHVNMDIRVQLCHPRTHCLHSVVKKKKRGGDKNV